MNVSKQRQYPYWYTYLLTAASLVISTTPEIQDIGVALLLCSEFIYTTHAIMHLLWMRNVILWRK